MGVQIEGSKRDGFAVVITGAKGDELHRSPTFKKKKHAARHLGRLKAQLREASATVKWAARFFAGDEGQYSELDNAILEHRGSHACIDATEALAGMFESLGNADELLAKAPDTTQVQVARRQLEAFGHVANELAKKFGEE